MALDRFSSFHITQCNRTVALGGLFTQLHSSQQKVALIGSGCSLATVVTAEISHYKAGQTEFAVYRHRPHGFSDFLKIFQISYSIQ